MNRRERDELDSLLARGRTSRPEKERVFDDILRRVRPRQRWSVAALSASLAEDARRALLAELPTLSADVRVSAPDLTVQGVPTRELRGSVTVCDVAGEVARLTRSASPPGVTHALAALYAGAVPRIRLFAGK